MNRGTLDSILKTAVMDTIDAYPLEAMHAYTDGSAFKASLNDGYGADIIYPDIHPNDVPKILGPSDNTVSTIMQKSQLLKYPFCIFWWNLKLTVSHLIIFVVRLKVSPPSCQQTSQM
jgi:hypothetical protein